MTEVCSAGFPHSDVSGSKVARHLPEAYRSRATSFIASSSQGIHRMLLDFLSGNLTTACTHAVISARMHVVSGALNANAIQTVFAYFLRHSWRTPKISLLVAMSTTLIDLPAYSIVNVRSFVRYPPLLPRCNTPLCTVTEKQKPPRAVRMGHVCSNPAIRSANALDLQELPYTVSLVYTLK
jgi:hypothetical protein